MNVVLVLLLTLVRAAEIVDWRDIAFNGMNKTHDGVFDDLAPKNDSRVESVSSLEKAQTSLWDYGFLLALRLIKDRISNLEKDQFTIPDFTYAPLGLKCSNGTLRPVAWPSRFERAHVLTRDKNITIFAFQDLEKMYFQYSNCEKEHLSSNSINGVMVSSRIYWEIMVTSLYVPCRITTVNLEIFNTVDVKVKALNLKTFNKVFTPVTYDDEEFNSYISSTLIPQFLRSIRNQLLPIVRTFSSKDIDKLSDLACSMLFEES